MVGPPAVIVGGAGIGLTVTIWLAFGLVHPSVVTFTEYVPLADTVID